MVRNHGKMKLNLGHDSPAVVAAWIQIAIAKSRAISLVVVTPDLDVAYGPSHRASIVRQIISRDDAGDYIVGAYRRHTSADAIQQDIEEWMRTRT